MYLPYLRGRMNELLAVRQLVAQGRLGAHIIPIIEPVNITATLVSTLEAFIAADHPVAIIRNPKVGRLGLQTTNSANPYLARYEHICRQEPVIMGLIMQQNTREMLQQFQQSGTRKDELLVICTDHAYVEAYTQEFSDYPPRFVLVPDDMGIRRRVKGSRIFLDDKFHRLDRNADYQQQDDEFFSDDHLWYQEEGYLGFSDFSIIGNEYFERGFAPLAVAIHLIYLDEDNCQRVRHFVSDSNEDIRDPAGKFFEALEKLVAWHNDHPQLHMTDGLKALLTHHDQQRYPGLGVVKRLTLMHHLELMSQYFDGEY